MIRQSLTLMFILPVLSAAQDEHDHPVPEKLGTVSFPTSCKPAVQQEFNRAVALLHSFAYKDAEEAFQEVSQHDHIAPSPIGAAAMTHFHQLWDLPPSPEDLPPQNRRSAKRPGLEASERERGFIHALSMVFTDTATVPYKTRAENYEAAMRELAVAIPRTLRPKCSTRSH